MIGFSLIFQYMSPAFGRVIDALRAAVKAAGIKRIARMSGVPRSKVQAFVNEGTMPHPSTIAKIAPALRGALLTKVAWRANSGL